MTQKLKPLMQFVLNEELGTHPELNEEKETHAVQLAQELSENLWKEEQESTTFFGKIKAALSDEISLPQKLFDKITDFRTQQGLGHKKKEMQQVMFYVTKAFQRGTEILGRACYLFHHNPQAFEKYATNSVDFQKDLHESAFDEENVFMPALPVWPAGTAIATGQAAQEYDRAEDRRLPLFSFAPIKYGFHPAQETVQSAFNQYRGLFSEFTLKGFPYDSCKYEPLKKLLYLEQPESNYPANRHTAIVVALNEFNKRLQKEPECVCAHKDSQKSNNQHQR